MANWRAAYGIDLRDPTGDLRVIEFCLAIPQTQFLTAKEPRSLVRRAFSGDLPERVLWNKRKGRQDPTWFDRIAHKQAEYAAEVQSYRSVPRVAEALDLDRLAMLVDAWPDVETSHQRDVEQKYRLGLLRGLHAARYLIWSDAHL